MKRLKNILLAMEPNTSTYKEMYEGYIRIVDPTKNNMEYAETEDWCPTYYYQNIGFTITATHKLAQDKPTVLITIPCGVLGIDVRPFLCADRYKNRLFGGISQQNLFPGGSRRQRTTTSMYSSFFEARETVIYDIANRTATNPAKIQPLPVLSIEAM